MWGIVESPWGSGVLLLAMTTGVVISGAFLERRAFCRHVCFLGGVAGNYSRAGMVRLRADETICATCRSKAACFNGTATTPGCPVFEFPRTMDDSANCVLCANCVKACPNGAITLTVQPPTSELWFLRNPRIEGAFLAVAIMGIVFVQNITMLSFWPDVEAWLARVAHTDAPAVISTIVFTEGRNVVTTTLAVFGGPGPSGSAALVSMTTIQVLQYAILAVGYAGSLYTAWRIAGRRPIVGSVWGQFLPYAVVIALFAAVNVVLFAIPMAHRM